MSTSAEQTSFLPKCDPDGLIASVRAEHSPVASVCLFSGGNDSTVLADRCHEHYDLLAFIDTGTALPGVRKHVEEVAWELDKPLRVLESGDAFRRMVLHPQMGFPGPGQHGRAYNRLKERQLERLRKDLKQGYGRKAKVLYLTGLRRAESRRRKQRMPVTFHGSIVFVNPLIDWTNEQMRAYRAEHLLPQSDVAALIHRSGECNCGSFAAPGEREELQALWPVWFDETIASLEREAAAQGIRSCRWGEYHTAAAVEDAGPLCSDCQLKLDLALVPR